MTLSKSLGKNKKVDMDLCRAKEWASLTAHLVKNLPAIQETPVRFLGWEDPLEKGKATLSNILAWRKSGTRLSGFHFQRMGKA